MAELTIILILVVYVIFIWIDFIPVVKTKKWKLIVPSAVLFCLAAGVQLLYELNVNVPSPAVPISDFFNGIFNLK